MPFMSIISLNPQNNHEIDPIISPILQMGKSRLIEVKHLGKGHLARDGQINT